MPFVGDQDVFWLQLSVNDPLVMKDLNADNDLGNQHPDDGLSKDVLFAFEVIVNVPLRHVLHHNVNFTLVLESLPDPCEQRMTANFADTLTLENIELLDLPFINYFEGVL